MVQKMIKRVVGVLVLVMLFAGIVDGENTYAKTTNVKKKYAKALASGEMQYKKYYALCDVTGDGVKEFLGNGEAGESFCIYTVKKGKVKKLLEYYPEWFIEYEPAKKMFWVTGDGDGSWCVGYRLKGKQLVEKVRYMSGTREKNGKYITVYEKTVGNKTTRISNKKYRKIYEGKGKKFSKFKKAETKQDLIKKLLLK